MDLAGLRVGNLIEILETIASTPHTTESIYNWTNRAREYCLDLVKRTDSNEILNRTEEPSRKLD